ncbi:MAG: hypothetical protein J2P13_05255 [Acidobacteria bacterium]|nr:hypothetical protein [Acidobacteriota bacterium]
MMAKRIAILLVMALGALALSAGEVLDRVVATVNGHAILLSDVLDELRYECLLSGREPAGCDFAQNRRALDRLLDQELLGEQMRGTGALRPEEVEKQIESLKADLIRSHPEESWNELLSSYGLSEESIEQHVSGEVRELAFLDARFRPSIEVTPEEIERYYKDELVPRLKPGDPVSLTEASGKIREILVQDKINRMLDSWLETLRRQAQIHIAPADASTEAADIQRASVGGN